MTSRSIRDAYHPIRALRRAWGLLVRAPALGWLALATVVVDAGWTPLLARFLPVGPWGSPWVASVLWLAAALWIANCGLEVALAQAVPAVVRRGRFRSASLLPDPVRWLAVALTRYFTSLLGLVSLALAMFALGDPLVNVIWSDGQLAFRPRQIAFAAGGALGCYCTLGWSLAPQAAAIEGLSPLAALRRSWELARGSRWAMLRYSSCLSLLMLLGLLAFGIGFFAAGALAAIAEIESYRRLVEAEALTQPSSRTAPRSAPAT